MASLNPAYTEIFLSHVPVDDTLLEGLTERLTGQKWDGVHLSQCTGMIPELLQVCAPLVEKLSIMGDFQCLDKDVAFAILEALKQSKIQKLLLRVQLSLDLANALYEATLSESCNLQELILPISHTCDASIERLSHALCQSKTLRALRLNRNDLTWKMEEQQIETLMVALRAHPSLKEMSVQGSSCTANSMAAICENVLPTLTRLDLSNHRIGGDSLCGLPSLALALSSSNTLKFISLSGHAISESETALLVDAIANSDHSCQMMEELQLNKCNLDDASVTILGKHLPKLNRLAVLQLRNNPFGTDGLEALCQGASKNWEIEQMALPTTRDTGAVGDEMDRIKRQIHYHLALNRAGRKVLRTNEKRIPLSVWPSTHCDPNMTAEDDIVAKYKAMLKMGMPAGAVEQRMKINNVPSNIAETVLASSTRENPEELKVVEKYKKMIKMGLPPGAVQQKMLQAGVAPSMIDAVMESVSGSSSDKATTPTSASSAAANTSEEEPAPVYGNDAVSESEDEDEVDTDITHIADLDYDSLVMHITEKEQKILTFWFWSKQFKKKRAVLQKDIDAYWQELTCRAEYDGNDKQQWISRKEIWDKANSLEDYHDTSYSGCKEKIDKVVHRMQEIGTADVILPDKELQISLRCEYLRLDRAFKHFSSALVETDEFKAEQAKKEKEWEDSHAAGNLEALKKIRRHMPLNIRQLSEADLSQLEGPNWKVLPKAIVRKFKRTSVLELIRVNPAVISDMHADELEALGVAGLTLTERRALYEHLKEVGLTWEVKSVDNVLGRKFAWFSTMKKNLKETMNLYERHVQEYGPPGSHPYATREQPDVGCTLIGRQCPLKADSVVNYDADYGWPDGPLYENPDAFKEEEAPELDPAEQAKSRRAHLVSLIVGASKTRASSSSNLRPETKTFLHTLGKYLDCRKQMDAKYMEVDELQIIANFAIKTDSNGIQSSNGGDDLFKPCYQQQTVDGTAVTTAKDLYQAAKIAQPIYQNVVTELVDKVCEITGTERQQIDVEFSALKKLDPDSVVNIEFAPLKGKDRALEKATDDYSQRSPGPGVSWLFDIVRGSIKFSSEQQIAKCLELMQADPAIHIVKAKNRFAKPTLTGYRDINMCIQIDVVDGEYSFKHTCEIQIHHKDIKSLTKSLHSHDFYEYFRKYFAGATESLKDRLEDLKMIGEGGVLDDAILKTLLEKGLDEDRLQRLGRLFRDQLCEYNWALRAYGKLLELQMENYGPESPVVADSYKDIAMVLNEQGRLTDAFELLQASLGIQIKIYGNTHISIADTYRRMAMVVTQQGQLGEALGFFKQALAIEETVPREHGSLPKADTLNYIAKVLVQQNKLEEAMKACLESLDIKLANIGNEHWSVADTYHTLGTIFFLHGKLDEAMAQYKMALETIERTVGEQHAMIATTFRGMANVFKQQGNLDDAIDLYQKSLQVFRKKNNRSLVAETCRDIADVLETLGKDEEAAPFREEAASIDKILVLEDTLMNNMMRSILEDTRIYKRSL
ncbi:MAG: hypothetical protein SGBAC_003774 [Bacillariaceae sp.]